MEAEEVGKHSLSCLKIVVESEREGRKEVWNQVIWLNSTRRERKLVDPDPLSLSLSLSLSYHDVLRTVLSMRDNRTRGRTVGCTLTAEQ